MVMEALAGASRRPRSLAALRALAGRPDPAARVDALGLSFPTPVGLAAGFDKDADAFEALGALGFGFVEVGTVTGLAQPGNPRPRLFRLKSDRALVNRMGFNNAGADAVAAALAQRRRRPGESVLGINVGKSKVVALDDAIADYELSVRALAPFADYLVVNVSSPNTPSLRDLQTTEQLKPLLLCVQNAAREAAGRRRPPAILVKIAPDLTDAQVDAVADLALEIDLDGIVAVNTTTSREHLRSSAAEIEQAGEGGLSGAPLKQRATTVLERLYRRVGGNLVLVSVGGIEDADDAWKRICAGATLVQLYTALVYGGPSLPALLASGVAARARAAGYSRVQDAVGSAVG